MSGRADIAALKPLIGKWLTTIELLGEDGASTVHHATDTYRMPGSAPNSFVTKKPLAFETASLSPPPPLTLLCVLREHTAAVKRLAVSPDQSYFASGSLDGCIKIWQLKGLDKAAFPRYRPLSIA